MRKQGLFLTCILALFFILALAACGDGGGGSGDDGISAPGNVEALAGDSASTLSWDDVPGALSYNIYWSAITGEGTNGTKITGVTSPYVHEPLVNGSTYYYVVTAENGSDESLPSTEVSATPTAPVDPAGIVFMTSVTGSGNLGSWPEANGEAGLAAGDAICNTLAADAGLEGTFVAWLSDDNNDAYCHMLGLSGKKASNCGVAELPAPPGPWVRTDGFPFGETLDQIIGFNGVIYSPIMYDENGVAADVPVSFFTATTRDGIFENPYGWTSCSNWTSNNSGTVMRGYSHRTSRSWTEHGGMGCGSGRLICFQLDATGDLPAFQSSGNIVFVTTGATHGDFGGLAGGDAICQSEASSAGLANASYFKAWLSTSVINAPDRIVNDGPWVRIDGVKIADNIADLLDDRILSGINVNPLGIYHSNQGVWTGTDKNGALTANNCADWVDLGSSSDLGIANDATGQWTKGAWAPCTNTQHLYCFEDAP